MTAKILAFPGVIPPRGDDATDRVPGLTGRQRALVISEEPSGFVSVRMRPARTDAERRCVSRFNTAEEARRFAARTRDQFPTLYVLTIDRTDASGGNAA